MIGANWTIEDWTGATVSQRAAWRHQIAATISPSFVFKEEVHTSPSRTDLGLPELVHSSTATEWVLVPECSFTMGLSSIEERAARALVDPPPLNIDEMRPLHSVTTGPFLIMKYPLAWGLVTNLVEIANMDDRPMFDGPVDLAPAYLSRSEIENVATTLGFSLPTEEQWECACRGGTQTLFFFGDTLPEHEELALLVGGDVRRARPNPFGLHGLFVGEWCRDRFRSSYTQSEPTKDFVVRGGGSAFWPWQDAEWAFCVSAMRLPSSDLIGGLAAGRLVLDLR